MKNPTTHIILIVLLMFFMFSCEQSKVNTNKPTATTSGQSKGKKVKETKPIPENKTTDHSGESDGSPEDEPMETTVVDACGNTNFDLMNNLYQSASHLSGTPYSRELKNDCSGIFHQMLDGMRDQCPNAILPSINDARSSRGIAGWYAKHDDIRIIRDPAREDDLIQPGVAMFYGHAKHASRYNYKTMTIDTLTARGTGINHVAIVMEVNRDENGVLQSYVIFHGKNVGKPAGTTISRLSYDNHPELPVYGNWGEPWLAVADILVEKE